MLPKSRILRKNADTESQLANRAAASNLVRFVTYYRALGHRLASLDPLAQTKPDPSALYQLDPKRYGLSENMSFNVDGIISTEATESQTMPLNKIIERLNRTYAGAVASQIEELQNVSERRWCNELVETFFADRMTKSNEDKLRTMHLLTKSEVFDHFMAKKFPQVKRYGLEGAESMMIVMDEIFRLSAESNLQDVVIGMPHRGRLNLLTDLLKCPPRSLFHKIKGNSEFPPGISGTGDVLSHVSLFLFGEEIDKMKVARSVDLDYPHSSARVHVSLLHNPSHLEAINPVTAGKTRAKQFDLLKAMVGNSESSSMCDIGDKALCVQLHGDSAFAGQGVVMETLALSNLPHYTCGGSIHLIVNNQIGYTTQAQNARSTIYSSDVGKIIDAPVIHVNGDCPEDVAIATRIAFEYRNQFRKDVIIDLIAYRRMGHNELDEPAFTQPVMYKNIRGRKSVPKLYEEKLVNDGILTQAQVDVVRSDYLSFLDSELEASYSFSPEADTLRGKWSSMTLPKETVSKVDTGVDVSTLKKVGIASVESHGITPHTRLSKFHITPRLAKLESGTGLDWATCEALAFGSLLLQGYDVRISGQDVGRGTFSQRHAMLVDQNDEHVVIPLNHITENQGKMEIANSNLSEFAVLGFEIGVSWENPNRLVIWEAQFGDFFNGAQIIIDTFLSSSESKWLRQTGLVMLLPHGYDGAGPEHSSCRIERFLQLTDAKFDMNDTRPENCNMHVVYPTTPAQMFHVLRRQLARNYRRPLVIAGPKTLLRHPQAVSSITEMAPGTSFQNIIVDAASKSSVKRVVFCSGKLYYELAKERAIKGLDERVAIVRLEEIAPFPWNDLESTLKEFLGATEYVWAQEEPQNQGCYTFVAPRLQQILPQGIVLQYVGRQTLAVPATGIGAHYKAEQAFVIARALEC
ncbi:hypothetical protein HDU84_000134 [Entophlyctis sp. JEL0112]|nr:hypothetical protein HDU84_000134 [Entophlyctis sp. JEL0112]